MATSRIFVTGGTGRIGQPLVTALVASGHDVVALARSDGGASVLEALGATVVRGDLDDLGALSDGVRGAQTVYHLAGGVRGKGDAVPDHMNRQGTENLLLAIGQVGADALDSVVFASTCAVYGDRSSLWVEEDFKTSPNTDYGISKVQAEDAVTAAAAELGFRAAIARIAAVYGPEFPFTMADRMQASKGYLPGEGRNHIPVIHVEDCVAALQVLGDRGEGIFHVADQSTPTTREFYDHVQGLSGGKKMVFWSTWVPSYVQLALARKNEAVKSRMGRKPRFTPDNWRLFTNSVRLKTQKLEKGLNFEWRHPTYQDGLRAVFGG
jgi:nucleoside-diphosphate-sugar epimerase